MAIVTIKSIGKQNIMSDEDFEWVKENLNKPLPLSSIEWGKSGNILYIAVWKAIVVPSVVILWINENEVSCTFDGIETIIRR